MRAVSHTQCSECDSLALSPFVVTVPTSAFGADETSSSR